MPDSLDGELLKALLDEASLPRAVQGIAANLVQLLPSPSVDYCRLPSRVPRYEGSLPSYEYVLLALRIG